MGTKLLHFSIGEGFGDLLTTIAKEHLVEDKDVDWGIRTLTEGLDGMSEKMAFEILLGVKKINTHVETQDLSVSDGDGMCEYVKYNTKKIDHKLRKINRTGKILHGNLRNAITRVKFKSVYIPTDILAPKFLKTENSDNDLDDLLKETYVELYDYLTFSVNFISASVKYIGWIKKLKATGERLGVSITKELDEYKEIPLPNYLTMLHSKIKELESGNILSFEEEENELMKDLDTYMEGAKAIDSLKSGPTLSNPEGTEESKIIEPVDPKDKWDAGWIAQDGTYYALNGHIANMLHLAIADALVAAGVIPEDFDGEVNADVWLERKGWVKQHGDHILYSGYDNSSVGHKDIPISRAQLDVITTIIRHHHGGIIWPGYNPANRCSVLSWANSAPLQFKLKWFAW